MSETPGDTFELINALIRRLMEHEEPGRTIACGFRIGVQDVGKSQAGEGLILRMKRLKPSG